MSKWVNRLELKDLWQARYKKKLTIQELAKAVARRIRKMPCYKYKKYKDELEDIAISFEICSDDIEEFDSILETLYDWADTLLPTPKGQMQRKMCWVDTF